MLDKQHPIPLYYQLAEQIKTQIRSGELRHGDQLPSERSLGEQAGISRMTVRQATNYLVAEGVLEVRPGVGTFVAQPKFTQDLLHLLGFTEAVLQQGGTVFSRVIEQKIVDPPAHIAKALKLGPTDSSVKIVRLRFCESVPLLLETIFIPVLLCPGLETDDLATRSLYAILDETYGLHPARISQQLEATVANSYEAELFGIEPGTAMILLEGTTYSDGEQPMEHFKAVYRGDRFKFDLESRRPTGAAASEPPVLNLLFE